VRSASTPTTGSPTTHRTAPSDACPCRRTGGERCAPLVDRSALRPPRLSATPFPLHPAVPALGRRFESCRGRHHRAAIRGTNTQVRAPRVTPQRESHAHTPQASMSSWNRPNPGPYGCSSHIRPKESGARGPLQWAQRSGPAPAPTGPRPLVVRPPIDDLHRLRGPSRFRRPRHRCSARTWRAAPGHYYPFRKDLLARFAPDTPKHGPCKQATLFTRKEQVSLPGDLSRRFVGSRRRLRPCPTW
jgi:hypothetical protein